MTWENLLENDVALLLPFKQNYIRIRLGNFCWIRKIPNLTTNNISIWFSTYQTWPDPAKTY